MDSDTLKAAVAVISAAVTANNDEVIPLAAWERSPIAELACYIYRI